MKRFDLLIDRKNTDSAKWDRYKGTDIIPMWLADMDFKTPEPILNAIRAKLADEVIGYGNPPQSLFAAIRDRLERLYDWRIEEQDIVFVPQVVPGLNLTCLAFVDPDEAMVVATPVYPPFLQVEKNCSRKLHQIKMRPENGSWPYPAGGLAATLAAHPEIRMLYLCNPHNPLGRAFTRPELAEITQICAAHDLLICSDEIHAEILYDGRRHTPIASMDAATAHRTITLMSPGKTFNMAGVTGSFAVIENPDLRQKFVGADHGVMPEITSFAFGAMEAAYRECEAWKAALLQYLQQNRDYLKMRMARLPKISMNSIEATYLAWLDVSALNLEDPVAFFEAAGVGLSDGRDFAAPGFLRLNFACPRIVLEHACNRIEAALSGDTHG